MIKKPTPAEDLPYFSLSLLHFSCSQFSHRGKHVDSGPRTKGRGATNGSNPSLPIALPGMHPPA